MFSLYIILGGLNEEMHWTHTLGGCASMANDGSSSTLVIQSTCPIFFFFEVKTLKLVRTEMHYQCHLDHQIFNAHPMT